MQEFKIIDKKTTNGYGNAADTLLFPIVQYDDDIIMYPYSYNSYDAYEGFPYLKLNKPISHITYLQQFFRPRINHWWRNIYKNRIADKMVYDFGKVLKWNNIHADLHGCSREFLITRKISLSDDTWRITLEIKCKKKLKGIKEFIICHLDLPVKLPNGIDVRCYTDEKFRITSTKQDTVFGPVTRKLILFIGHEISEGSILTLSVEIKRQ